MQIFTYDKQLFILKSLSCVTVLRLWLGSFLVFHQLKTFHQRHCKPKRKQYQTGTFDCYNKKKLITEITRLRNRLR